VRGLAKGFFERPCNDLEHRVRLLQGLIVPEAQYPYTPLLEAACALLVVGRLHGHRMTTAVELDRKTGLDTVEIQDEAAGRVLAPELPAVQATPSQSRPDAHLGVRRHVTHLAGAMDELWTTSVHVDPHPFSGRG